MRRTKQAWSWMRTVSPMKIAAGKTLHQRLEVISPGPPETMAAAATGMPPSQPSSSHRHQREQHDLESNTNRTPANPVNPSATCNNIDNNEPPASLRSWQTACPSMAPREPQQQQSHSVAGKMLLPLSSLSDGTTGVERTRSAAQQQASDCNRISDARGGGGRAHARGVTSFGASFIAAKMRGLSSLPQSSAPGGGATTASSECTDTTEMAAELLPLERGGKSLQPPHLWTSVAAKSTPAGGGGASESSSMWSLSSVQSLSTELNWPEAFDADSESVRAFLFLVCFLFVEKHE